MNACTVTGRLASMPEISSLVPSVNSDSPSSVTSARNPAWLAMYTMENTITASATNRINC